VPKHRNYWLLEPVFDGDKDDIITFEGKESDIGFVDQEFHPMGFGHDSDHGDDIIRDSGFTFIKGYTAYKYSH
jgi:hypothetical protein